MTFKLEITLEEKEHGYVISDGLKIMHIGPSGVLNRLGYHEKLIECIHILYEHELNLQRLSRGGK